VVYMYKNRGLPDVGATSGRPLGFCFHDYLVPAQEPAPLRCLESLSKASGQPMSFCSSTGSERMVRSVWWRARAALNSAARRPMDERIDITLPLCCPNPLPGPGDPE